VLKRIVGGGIGCGCRTADNVTGHLFVRFDVNEKQTCTKLRGMCRKESKGVSEAEARTCRFVQRYGVNSLTWASIHPFAQQNKTTDILD
jgi:hypothetical protein